MSAIKSLAYCKVFTSLNIEASVHMYIICRNVRTIIFWKLQKKKFLMAVSSRISITHY